jgi:hypothetical protein
MVLAAGGVVEMVAPHPRERDAEVLRVGQTYRRELAPE